MFGYTIEVLLLGIITSTIGYLLYIFHRNASSIDTVLYAALTIAAVFLQIRSGLYDNLHIMYTVLVVIWGTRIVYVSIKALKKEHPTE